MIDGRLSVAYTVSPAVRGDVQGSYSARIQSQTNGKAVRPQELHVFRFAQCVPELGARSWDAGDNRDEAR